MKEWVTIIKVDNGMMKPSDVKYYSQFIGQTFPIIRKERNKLILPVKHCNGALTETFWLEKEVRKATKSEIHKVQLRIGAEKI